jgi:hypothetical protein
MAVVWLYTPYEIVLERILATLLVLAVVIGFALHPTTEIFYIRTTARLREPGGHEVSECDLLAVKVELVRLWLLFLPTFAAVALLVLSSTTQSSFLNDITSSSFAPFWFVPLEGLFAIAMIVLAGLGMWIHERWVIRNAEACSATSFRIRGRNIMRQVTYAFLGERGEHYGGDCIYVGLVKPLQLATVIFYKVQNPDRNKIAMGFLFHKFVILGHGVTELDPRTAAAKAVLAEITQPQ